MKRIVYLLASVIMVCAIIKIYGTSPDEQLQPTFAEGVDPKPEGMKWQLVESMSDEFEGAEINKDKWQISGQEWIGRVPGLFMPENISVSDGSLKITATLLPDTIVKHGKKFTHGGGYVGSRESMKYGYYECQVRANKTFMSTTFWLINSAQGKEGCDKRTTELDILEVVGQICSKAEWMIDFDAKMNSNTHSRNIPEGCDYKQGSNKSSAYIGEKAYDGFHTYGCWWKSKDEILFYLDGKLVGEVAPPADFDLDMYLRMVVETYDWNPVPEDGGMNLPVEDRISTYNWVRTWELVE